MNSPQQIFIQQTRNYWSVLFTSEILKLSWAAVRFVWEILLPAATWQKNLRMESAAAPFQIGHLWWHGLLHHHHQWQLGLATRCCQRFLRISDWGRQLPITPKSKKFRSRMIFCGNFVAFCCLFSQKKFGTTWTLNEKRTVQWTQFSWVKISHQFTSDDKKSLNISGLQILTYQGRGN